MGWVMGRSDTHASMILTLIVFPVQAPEVSPSREAVPIPHD